MNDLFLMYFNTFIFLFNLLRNLFCDGKDEFSASLNCWKLCKM